MPVGLKPSPIYIVDTVTVKGKLCTYGSKTPAGANTGFLITYEDAGVVYWYREAIDTFTVLYDFNKNIGEGWSIEGLSGGDDSPCSRSVEIIDKKIVNINGYNLRSITIQFSTGSSPFINTAIEAMGGSNTPYPDFYPCLTVGHADELKGYRPLRCVNHPDIGFYDFKQASSCDYSVTSINDNSIPLDINITPNPFSSHFLITLKSEAAAEIFVYDVLGRIVINKTIPKGENALPTEDWAKGLYILKLVRGEGVIYQSKLVKN
jgi:hypothetical protein